MQKLNKVHCTKAINEKFPNIEDFVHVYRELTKEKYGKRLDLKSVLAMNRETLIVSVSGLHGKNSKTAYEDICNAVQSDTELALLVQSILDT